MVKALALEAREKKCEFESHLPYKETLSNLVDDLEVNKGVLLQT